MSICVAFSGGETSAYLSIKINEKYQDSKFVFCNTSQEHNETLDFIDRCDKKYGLNVIWLEADVNPEKGVGTGYRVTNYEDAKRNGEVFEDVIKKYGVPNVSYLHCSRELKLSPFNAWQKENFPDSHRAIGIRSDEIDRVTHDYKEKKYLYPLAFQWPTTKNEINRFWHQQEFRLNLAHYESNCRWCYKKSFNKLSYICQQNPEVFDFPERMEKEYGHIKADDRGRVIFRGNRDTQAIRIMSINATEPADDSKIYEVNHDLFGHDEMDLEFDSCGSESCEPM